MPGLRSSALAIGALALAAAFTLACDPSAPGHSAASASAPAATPPADLGPDAGAPADAGFAEPASCGGCHPAELAAWTGSHHDLAMQVATPETVLGDFDDSSFTAAPEAGGGTTHFRRDGDRFVIETEGPDAEPARFEVAYTFGVEPLQQYLVELPGGRLQSFTVAWDVAAGRWFSLYPDERIAPDDPLHWTGRLQRWNVMCADCHSTALETRFDLDANAYETHWVALDVSCQACHGAGQDHVDWARSLADETAPPADASRRLTGQLASGTAAGEIETCAPCHAHRRRVSERTRPGDPLLDHYAPSFLREDLYAVDGQIEAEVYVYGSFVQSLMHRRGVRCSDCHEPHSLQLRAQGNALCTRCHGATPDARFPTLEPGSYDSPAHHFHTPGSEGAACVSCHMPARTYMQVDPRRDHSLRVPRPDLTLELGTPNACNGCHADRDARWAADFLAKRRGDGPLPGHFAEALAAARAGTADAAARLQALAVDAQAPAIARATAVAALAHLAPRQAEAVSVAAAKDDDALVRLAAAAALETATPERATPALLALVRDPLRAVRVQAAHTLAFLGADGIGPEDRRAYDLALDEYRATQRALADLPESHLNLGALAARRGRPGAAESAYGTALRLDPDFLPARANLANLQNAQGRNEEAERSLRAAVASAMRLLARSPADPGLARDLGQMQYSLGLLLAELGRMPEATSELAQAAQRLPELPRVQYNYGLALQQSGRRDLALPALERAAQLAPDDPVFQHALAVFHAQAGDRARAIAYARRVVELTGGAPGTRELLQQIESMPPR